MFKRILVPLDGSSRAERAIPVAAHLADQHGGTVVLIRVVGELAAYDGRVLADLPFAPWMHDLDSHVRTAAAYLSHAATHGALDGVKTEMCVGSGVESEGILTAARARRADAIVLCGQGRSGTQRWGLDRVAEQVIRDAAIPVLAVPEEGPLAAYAGVARLRPLRALVALDGSALAEAALAPAVHVTTALADPGLGALHLMHVARDETSREDARSYLSAVAHELRSRALAEHLCLLTWSVVCAGDGDDVAATLIAQANRPRSVIGVDSSIRALYGGTSFDGEIEADSFDGADLIVISTHGYAGLYQHAIGPIAEGVLRLASCPVLVVRPGMRAGDEVYRWSDLIATPVADRP